MDKKEKDMLKLARSILGTLDSVEIVVERFGLDLDPDVAEDDLLDHGIEMCPMCWWWVESYELVDEDSNPVDGCESCRVV